MIGSLSNWQNAWYDALHLLCETHSQYRTISLFFLFIEENDLKEKEIDSIE